MKSLLPLLLILILSACSSSQSQKEMSEYKGLTENSEAAMRAPYVLMISIDGYRHDYTKKYAPRFLSKFAKEGVALRSLIPSFPTKTFPNHYSLVTGLYPGHHGIVANHFYAPDLDLEYKLSDRDAVTNPKFYSGVPLWNLSQEQGMMSATYFWPGSEAPIGDKYPSYWEVYDHGAPHERRIEKVMSWLRLPEKNRPHFLTLYFSDVDSAGHRYGPDSAEVKEAIEAVDSSIEKLYAQIEALDFPVNVIIVSDHGMTEIKRERSILLNDAFKKEDEKKLLEDFKTVGSGPIVQFYYEGNDSKKAESLNKLVRILNRSSSKVRAYKPSKAPSRWNLAGNPRMGDVFAVSSMGVFIGMKGDRLMPGNHGYDTEGSRDMHSIFYAKGPAFKSGRIYPSAKNIDVYPLVAKILGLKLTHEIDGNIKPMQSLLK